MNVLGWLKTVAGTWLLTFVLLLQNSLAYATRVRTIKNDVTKMEASKEILRLKRQVEHWKEQAGLSPEQRTYVDLADIENKRNIIDEDE